MSYLYQHVGCPVLMGRGCIQELGSRLKAMGAQKVLIIHGKTTQRIGLLKRITDQLDQEQLDYVGYDGVLPDPTDTLVEEGAKLAREEQVDAIVAVGGGSALDTAKALNVLIHNPPPLSQYYGAPRHLEPGLPLICVPTTAGTGSEITRVSVITNTKNGNEKAVVLHQSLLPVLSVVDPELMQDMPASLTAATGMDALSHSVESMTGAGANPMVDAIDREVIRMIKANLPLAVADGKNMEAREAMAYAATLAGIAFTNTRVHLGHAISHVLGAHYHIPHGVACALALPAVVRWSAAAVPGQVKMVGEALGCPVPERGSPEEIGAVVAQALNELKRAVNIPTLGSYGVQKGDLPGLLLPIKAQSPFAARPQEISDQELLALLEEIYDG